jgi:GNAT superfamily N-acetyltransferase
LPEETITYLEMDSREQLIPGHPSPACIAVREVGRGDASLIRDTYERVGTPLGWVGRSAWSDTQWQDELSLPGVHMWVANIDAATAGLIELEAELIGDVGIVVFGLVPEFVGKGFGGEFLTIATRLAWEVEPLGEASTKRVWVQTSSSDHPHALPNYESRGFRAFRTERRTRTRKQARRAPM